VKIAALYVYPIKGCRGIAVKSWAIKPYGLEHDRTYLITNTKYEFLTQRSHPKLAMIRPAMPTEEGLTLEILNQDQSVEDSIFVPRRMRSEESVSATVWKDQVGGFDQGDEVAQWLSRHLDKSCRLVFLNPTFRRFTSEKYTPKNLQGSAYTGFADAYPFLVISQESLDEVNRRLYGKKDQIAEYPLPMNRFRPNIVLTGGSAFIEDKVKQWVLKKRATDGKDDDQSNQIIFYNCKPCSRCSVPRVVQSKGVRDESGEPTHILETFRTGKHLGLSKPDWEDQVFFGVNCVHNHTEKENEVSIEIGDELVAFS